MQFGRAMGVIGLWGILMPLGMGVPRGASCADTQKSMSVERLPAIMMKSPETDAWLLDVKSAGDRLIAVGGRGVILISDDRGGTWTQVSSPVDVTLTTVYFVDPQNGWIGGHEATLLRTRDGGNTWSVEQASPEGDDPVLHVWFSKRHGGFAIGGRSLMLRLVEGRWQRRDLMAANDDGFSPHLFGIAELSNGTVMVAAESGHLFRSDSGGASWLLQPTPYAGSWFGMANVEMSGRLLLYGMLGHVFVSEDGGAVWNPISVNTQSSLFSHYGSAKVYLAGADGTVLEADPEQLTFSQLTSSLSRRTVTALVKVTSDRWVATTTRGLVMFSTP